MLGRCRFLDREHPPVVGEATRAAIIRERRLTGPSAGVIAEFVAEVGPVWHERHQAKPVSQAAEAGCRCWWEVPAGVRRPAPGRARAPSSRGHARRAGLLVRRVPLHHHPGGPTVGREDQEKFISGKSNCFAARLSPRAAPASPMPASWGWSSASHGPAVEILADAGYQGLGARTGGRVATPPHRKFKKNPPDRYEEIHGRRRKAHSSRRIRVGPVRFVGWFAESGADE